MRFKVEQLDKENDDLNEIINDMKKNKNDAKYQKLEDDYNDIKLKLQN